MDIEQHIYKNHKITKSWAHANVTNITSAQPHTAVRNSKLCRSDCTRLAQRSGEGTNMHFNLFKMRRTDAIRRLQHKTK